jgi:SAM-dependent methyltransferase
VSARFSFEVINAGDYDSLRPGYAPQAAAWIMARGQLGRGSLVVDLAAGTGQLSRRFALPGIKLVAVEPARNMRAVFTSQLPGLPIVAGSAEAMPLRTGAADAVVAGNAFHHFDAERAVAEIRRVLRARGVFVVLWARTSGDAHDRYPQLRAVDAAVERARAAGPAAAAVAAALANWGDPPSHVPGFTPWETATFPMVQAIRSARLADLYATSSDVASLPPAPRLELLARIREICREFPETLELPRLSVVQLCFRETGDR